MVMPIRCSVVSVGFEPQHRAGVKDTFYVRRSEMKKGVSSVLFACSVLFYTLGIAQYANAACLSSLNTCGGVPPEGTENLEVWCVLNGGTCYWNACGCRDDAFGECSCDES